MSQETLAIEIAADHPAFDGHFPGQPILPGVALLAEVMEAAAARPAFAAALGREPQLAAAKFLAVVRPGTTLTIDFRLAARTLEWRADADGLVVASGRFARADLGVGSRP